MNYFLQNAPPESLSETVLIPSTAMIDFIKIFFQKSSSDQDEDIAAYKRICQQYQVFSF
jgi:hypothetical protein